ncbi:SHOCT domain-containing protein [Xanthomonas sp. CFBP 8703]|uniref:SHOCT domain-containing protein n=1 Tax=Xanthomonas bonasiae TaxID=2810351 RepID=A0ABS3B4Q6_9XANT|nr:MULTISPECIES: SHOCT domain-containing protein [Xanthomonas]MBD7922927.1 SHOCT domain-containing protein [Xanthomonas surreyensis]MBN6101889.1 SHOCT domain-containing protein [Xanthomonas bonasiae]MBN6113317.1 SHOCT domain-containing protein [Xanthomonas bonasiae]NYF20112.1 putative membrane protein [Xanthomonas sp. JAI131]
MGGFSIWHFVILFVVLALPVLVFAAVWLAMRRDQRAQASQRAASPPPLPPAASVEARLRALEALRAQGLIDQAEYERRRQQILAEL